MSLLARISHAFLCPRGETVVNPTRDINAQLASDTSLAAQLTLRTLEAVVEKKSVIVSPPTTWTNEIIHTTPLEMVITGNLLHPPIVPGSVTLTDDQGRGGVDDGNGNIISNGAGGGDLLGTLDYSDGAYNLNAAGGNIGTVAATYDEEGAATVTLGGDVEAALTAPAALSGLLATQTGLGAELTARSLQATLVRETPLYSGPALNVEEGFIEPTKPPFYDTTLHMWLTAAWPSDPGMDSGEVVMANAPQDRSKRRYEALRTLADQVPPTWVPAGPTWGVPEWQHLQDDPSGEPHAFYNVVAEATTGEVGDTGPRFTAMGVLRNISTSGARRGFTWNTPYLQLQVVSPTSWVVSFRGQALGQVTFDPSVIAPNGCLIMGVTSWGDQSFTVWVNGQSGVRETQPTYTQQLGPTIRMCGHSNQANSFEGGTWGMFSWSQAYDPAAAGFYDFVKSEIPGIFTF